MSPSRVIAVALLTCLLATPLASVARAQSILNSETAADVDTGPATLSADARAAITNVFRVPGKTIICGLGGAAALVVLLGTFGTQFQAASAVVDESCGGRWVVKPDDVRSESAVSKAFDWEAHRFDAEKR